jgi:hypothetical protein
VAAFFMAFTAHQTAWPAMPWADQKRLGKPEKDRNPD